MRQIQITVPHDVEEKVSEIIEDYSNDISSSEAKSNGEKVAQFTATVEANDIDNLTEDLKDLKQIEVGDLSIRVLKQESLIEKGQETKGSSSTLSQEEIYSKAQEFSELTKPQWALIGLSSAIAAYGLALNNVILVIGAMMLAPILSPFISSTVSLSIGDANMMRKSLRSGFKSIFIAIIVSYIAILPFDVSITPLLETIVSSNVKMILLSFMVGSSAALTFTTGYRDQIAGVAVAIALVPPLSAVGLGLKMQEYFITYQAGLIALMNVFAVVVAGFLVFRYVGLKPSTYYKKKSAEKIQKLIPFALLIMLVLGLTFSFISYENKETFNVRQNIRDEAQSYFGDSLIGVRFYNDNVKILVSGKHNVSKFRKRFHNGFNIRFYQLKEVK